MCVENIISSRASLALCVSLYTIQAKRPVEVLYLTYVYKCMPDA